VSAIGTSAANIRQGLADQTNATRRQDRRGDGMPACHWPSPSDPAWQPDSNDHVRLTTVRMWSAVSRSSH
jgi:hypothetical protein